VPVDYDSDQPLDDDTRQRLLERNRWQEVEENDRRFQKQESTVYPDQGDEEDFEDDVDEESEEDPDDPNDRLKPELRDELTRRNIPWNRKMRKAELVELLRKDEESTSDETE
jgi:hypothetical protein